ncbi:MAG: hypothetical protein AAGF57_06730 [Pseudomonadota bacterium]
MSSSSRLLSFALFALATLLLTLWIYWPGHTGPALLDDTTSVLVIGDLTGEPGMAWDYVTGDTSGPLGRPVSIASFVLERLLLGDDLSHSKQINIILHVINGGLVVWLFALLLRHVGTTCYLGLALALGACWLLSPLYVSTVLYVVQRMAMLAATFMLLSCISYCYFRQALAAGSVSIKWLVAAILSFVLAVFSKENAVVVLPIIVLMEALWFQFRDHKGQTMIWLQRATLTTMALGALGLLFIFDYESLAASYQHRHFDLNERLLTQSRILWDYLGQLYVPDVGRMGLYHDDYTVSTSTTSPPTTRLALVAWAMVLGLGSLCLIWQWGRYLVFCILWFIVGHSIEGSVFPLELYFEHRNYFPGIGLFLLAGLPLAACTKRWRETSSPLMVLTAFYVVWLATHTSSLVQVWSNHPLLILHHLNGHPDSFRANTDMAVQMANVGEFDAARKYSERAYSVSHSERVGDQDIRELALACIANEAVPPAIFDELGIENARRPFGTVVTLHTLVKLLQDETCPEFDRLRFANRLQQLFLDEKSIATASPNMYMGFALLENTLQRWEVANRYIDLMLAAAPHDTQGLLMKLHFVTALGKVAAADAVKSRLIELQNQGKLTVSEQQTLALYLEN